MLSIKYKSNIIYNEFMLYYFKSQKKAIKLKLYYNFIVKAIKKQIVLIPSLLTLYFLNLQPHVSFLKSGLNNLKNILFLNNTIFKISIYLIQQTLSFKSFFKKKFHFPILYNVLLYVIKIFSKGFKKILKVFGIVTGFLFI
jgi:hypothetical protein